MLKIKFCSKLNKFIIHFFTNISPIFNAFDNHLAHKPYNVDNFKIMQILYWEIIS